ncbi:type III secretion system export apparatus subunit SctV [Desulfospira joergensenii]|uniref:type III secretion system export apparatus subunit SctV n=1 Tax=Desulfospira joergensenii TaxID=53329 RepID=UPI0003B4EFA8|nr:type III secretion system export apparatus subunit SctV [Desulfospira joergensenii]
MSLNSMANNAVNRLSRHNDITLALFLVAIIGLMIIPLPTPLVDTLIGLNLGISLVVLMMSMYVATALDFSVFPTVLLFTTLYRLALNITTTRLILLEGDAGQIVYTFGNFVVAGNFVVGAVVFLILTIVQFLVIAKGSERVAEVGARFTLDAMPGKQMSIDADLRAGAIDQKDAQDRRNRITRESQMYGNMDGAMKFVKGDSIAGMIITVVNIVGGIIIGTLQHDLSAGAAIQKYGILTIGDGLVSQIPSLLISIGAGILITRTSDEDTDHLGGQMGDQILDRPKALLMAGGLLLLTAGIPGFPWPQIVVISVVLSGIGLVLLRAQNQPVLLDQGEELQKTLAPTVKARRKKAVKQKEEFAPTVPLLLDISADLGTSLTFDTLNNEIITLRRVLYYELGVPFPGITIRPTDALPSFSYTLLLHEIPVTTGTLVPGKVLVKEKESTLRMLNIESEKREDFLPEYPSTWVSEKDVSRLEQAGFGYMTHARILTYHASIILARSASEFLGLQETKYLMDKMEERFPELIKEAARLLPVQKVGEVLQRLVQERVSIRNLRAIFEAIVEWAPKEKDTVQLTEYVRSALRRQISFKYTGGLNVLAAVLVDPETEEEIRKSIRQTSSGAFLALSPEGAKKIVEELRKALGDYKKKKQLPVVMTSMDIRRYVRKLFEKEFYDIAVVSYQELTPEVSVHPIGRIRM